MMELATIPNGNTNNIPTKKQSELLKSFSDARDKWKIDPNSLKGFYLHTETSNLYCWEQAQGILYLYNVENGDCTPIWSSANPGENAEIWTVLPLPPTDAAAQQQNKQEDVLSMMVEIPAGAVPGQAMHIISPEGQEVQFIVPENVEPGMMMAIQYQKPCDYLLLHVVEDENTEFNNHIDAEFEEKREDFKKKYKLEEMTLTEIGESLPIAGQKYLFKTFTTITSLNVGKQVRRYIENLNKSTPWKKRKRNVNEEIELKIDANGAIIGSCLEQLSKIAGISHAHCQITCEKRGDSINYYVKDLNTGNGTYIDGIVKVPHDKDEDEREAEEEKKKQKQKKNKIKFGNVNEEVFGTGYCETTGEYLGELLLDGMLLTLGGTGSGAMLNQMQQAAKQIGAKNKFNLNEFCHII